MNNMFKKAREAYARQAHFAEMEKARNNEIKSIDIDVKDLRYNEPKGKPQASEEKVTETIENTEIYQRAKELILKAQRGQVGYGLDKYPEPLNADTWDMIETLNHIIQESVDKLHYEVMLLIKLEREAEKKLADFKERNEKGYLEFVNSPGNKIKTINDIRKSIGLKPLESNFTVNVTKEDMDTLRYAIDKVTRNGK